MKKLAIAIPRALAGRLASLLAALCLLPGAVAQADDKVLRIASLEWLPYVSENLPHYGLSSFIAASAAQKSGYQLKIEYFPWKRSMQLGRFDAAYAGYFPAYYTKERATQCHFSQPIGSSTVGLAYLKSSPLQWESVDDLAVPAKQAIGVVYGYSNGEQFDALVRQGRINIESSASDGLNMRKLVIGRLRAAVVDEAVLRYLLKTDPVLGAYANQIAFHPRPLAELKLYICFQQSAHGLEGRNAFDRGLQELNLHKMEDEYFQKLDAAGLASPAGSVPGTPPGSGK